MHRSQSCLPIVLASALLAAGTAPPVAAQTGARGTVGTVAPAEWSDGVFSLRVFKARKGSFEEMLRLTQTEIAPFYEQLGVRYIGFWRQIEAPGHEVPADHEVIYMLTRYESVEHWQATRTPWAWGEPDEDFARMALAMFERSSYVLEQEHLLFDGYLGGLTPRFTAGRLPPAEDDFQESCRAASRLDGAAARAYCECVEPKLPADPWSRHFYLAWLRVGGPERAELSNANAQRAHADCGG